MFVTTEPVVAEGPIAADAPRSGILEAGRYFLASLAALALDAGLLWTFVNRLSLPVWLAGAIAYSAGLVLVYGLSVRWVFARRQLHDPRREFVVFALLGLVGVVLNSTTLVIATSFGLALPFAKAIAAGIGFIANYASRKAILFSTRP